MRRLRGSEPGPTKPGRQNSGHSRVFTGLACTWATRKLGRSWGSVRARQSRPEQYQTTEVLLVRRLLGKTSRFQYPGDLYRQIGLCCDRRDYLRIRLPCYASRLIQRIPRSGSLATYITGKAASGAVVYALCDRHAWRWRQPSALRGGV